MEIGLTGKFGERANRNVLGNWADEDMADLDVNRHEGYGMSQTRRKMIEWIGMPDRFRRDLAG